MIVGSPLQFYGVTTPAPKGAGVLSGYGFAVGGGTVVIPVTLLYLRFNVSTNSQYVPLIFEDF